LIIDRDRLAKSFAGVAVGVAIATANRRKDLGAGFGNPVALSAAVGATAVVGFWEVAKRALAATANAATSPANPRWESSVAVGFTGIGNGQDSRIGNGKDSCIGNGQDSRVFDGVNTTVENRHRA
jgi:hypothetical protein